jgi:hypothetical protein
VDIAGSHHIWDSAAFWPAFGIIVAVLGIAATVWVTLRAANPKRRLYYLLLSDTPLITGRQDLSEELKVTYGSQELKSPHVVSVQLVSRGRRDIARDAFDNGQPLCLDLGTPIVECVKITTSPSDRPDPVWTTEDSKLLIGPSHFGGHQTTVLSLLVDGESPSIVPPQQSLVDVRIQRGDGRPPFDGPYDWFVAILTTTVSIFFSFFIYLNAPFAWPAAVAFPVVAVATIVFAVLSRNKHR